MTVIRKMTTRKVAQITKNINNNHSSKQLIMTKITMATQITIITAITTIPKITIITIIPITQ